MGVLGSAWVKVLVLGFSAHSFKDKHTVKCSSTVDAVVLENGCLGIS